MTSENTTNQRPLRSEVAKEIAANAEVADISNLRAEILNRVPNPADWHMQNRQARLLPFAPFFERLLNPNSPSIRVRSLVQKLATEALFRQSGWETDDIRPTPKMFDPRFNDAEDFIVPVFEILFSAGESDLLRLWMRELDAHVAATSRDTMQAMDEAEEKGAPPLRKDVVLVGGGPLTSIVASILGPYFSVTVVTEQRGLGKPWRNRPIYINSSSEVRDFSGAPLPLLDGTTTRVIGREQWNNLEANLLLQTSDTRDVTCADGSTARYAAGPRLGDLVATDIVFNADGYLVGQRVDVSQTRHNLDGSLQVVMIDTADGKRRTLTASACFFLTGPGPERSKVTHAASQSLYQQAADQVAFAIRDGWRDLERALATSNQLETAFPALEPLVQKTRQKQLRTEANRIARGVQKRLPRLLTLTAVETVYELWAALEELGAEPQEFPLTDLLATREAIAYIGNGDTARTLKELVDGNGPAYAYPAGRVRRKRAGRATIYNEGATSPQSYADANRRRYGGVYTSATRGILQKAERYRLVTTRSGEVRVEVSYHDEAGKLRRNRYGYAFDSTGLSRSPLEAQLPPAFQMSDVLDLAGIAVARGDDGGNLFIVGSATGTLAPPLPQNLLRIFQELGILENVISLWVNGLLAERLAYSYLARHPLTKTWPQRER